MSQECTHDCSTCGAACSSKSENFDPVKKLADLSRVGHVYAVMSGKGGVGKSMVTSMLAVSFAKRGYRTAILDADITGPSIPRAFGVEGMPLTATADEKLMNPVISEGGVQIVSSNLLLANATDPIIWRGALIASCVTQFWTDTYWDDVDYMFVDMPPGTGDVPLTVFQSLPVDGIIVVTSPQELVSMIVGKAVNMAEQMHLPITGLVENLSYFECPDCHKRSCLFGESHIEEISAGYGLPVLARVPIDPEIARLVDAGQVEKADTSFMNKAVESILLIDRAAAGTGSSSV